MSTWVRTVDSEPDDDDPKEVWFNPPANARKRKRSTKNKEAKKSTLPVMPVLSEAPVAPTEYPGDPTEQEVIDNVRRLLDTRAAGKV